MSEVDTSDRDSIVKNSTASPEEDDEDESMEEASAASYGDGDEDSEDEYMGEAALAGYGDGDEDSDEGERKPVARRSTKQSLRRAGQYEYETSSEHSPTSAQAPRRKDGQNRARDQKNASIECVYCNKFYSKNNMARHIQRKHPHVARIRTQATNPRFRCRFCHQIRSLYKKQTHYKNKHRDVWNERDGVSSTRTSDEEIDSDESEAAIRPRVGFKRVRRRGKAESGKLGDKGASMDHIAMYRNGLVDRQHNARCEALSMLKAYKGKAYSRRQTSSFLVESIPVNVSDLKDCHVERPHLFREVENALTDWEANDTVHFLLLTRPEARKVLQSGPLRVPIVVPAQFAEDASAPLSIKVYAKKIAKWEEVQVHDLKRDRNDELASEDEPNKLIQWKTTLTGAEAVRRLHDEDGMVMFDNLPVERRFPIPPFIVDVPDYQLLGPVCLPLNSAMGGLSGEAPNVSFQVLGSKGAHGTPGFSPNGVVSSFRVEEGRCLWIVWPMMAIEDYDAVQDTGSIPSGQFLVYLEPGDVLVLPAGTFHTVIFLTPTLMTGNFYWHPKDLSRMIQLAWLERKHGWITDEGRSGNLSMEIRRVGEMWADDAPGWAWSSDVDDWEIWTNTLNVSTTSSKSGAHGADSGQAWYAVKE